MGSLVHTFPPGMLLIDLASLPINIVHFRQLHPGQLEGHLFHTFEVFALPPSALLPLAAPSPQYIQRNRSNSKNDGRFSGGAWPMRIMPDAFQLPHAIASRLDAWGPIMRSALELARAGFLREHRGHVRRQRGGGLSPPWSTTTIRVGTDCSGLDAPIWALRQLGIPHAHVFSCDCWHPARSIIAVNSQPAGPLFSNMIGRPLDAVPQHDVYVCGFPCQPFSTLNNHSSFFRAAKAKPLKALVQTVLARSPALVVLENVPGIMRKKAGLQRVLRRMHAHCFSSPRWTPKCLACLCGAPGSTCWVCAGMPGQWQLPQP